MVEILEEKLNTKEEIIKERDALREKVKALDDTLQTATTEKNELSDKLTQANTDTQEVLQTLKDNKFAKKDTPTKHKVAVGTKLIRSFITKYKERLKRE